MPNGTIISSNDSASSLSGGIISSNLDLQDMVSFVNNSNLEEFFFFLECKSEPRFNLPNIFNYLINKNSLPHLILLILRRTGQDDHRHKEPFIYSPVMTAISNKNRTAMAILLFLAKKTNTTYVVDQNNGITLSIQSVIYHNDYSYLFLILTKKSAQLKFKEYFKENTEIKKNRPIIKLLMNDPVIMKKIEQEGDKLKEYCTTTMTLEVPIDKLSQIRYAEDKVIPGKIKSFIKDLEEKKLLEFHNSIIEKINSLITITRYPSAGANISYKENVSPNFLECQYLTAS